MTGLLLVCLKVFQRTNGRYVKFLENLFLATSLGGGGVIVITAVHPYNVVKKDHQHHPRRGNSATDPPHFLVLRL